MKLLHIDSGIQGDLSASRSISAAIVARLTADDPDLEVTYRDLVAAPIDHLLPADLAGTETETIVSGFLAADVVVIGTGLYNFTIPTQLKAWIDRMLLPGRTFRYGAAGPEGLAGDKRVLVALARGGNYAPGNVNASREHAETYLRGVFSFVGVGEPEFIIAEGLAFGEEARTAAIAEAITRAESVSLSRVA
jgi:FMN-dependent NADH-azoreductase